MGSEMCIRDRSGAIWVGWGYLVLSGPSGAFWCLLVLSEPICDYLVLSGAIWGYLVLSGASGAIWCRIWGYLGLLVLSVAIWSNLRLTSTIWRYLGHLLPSGAFWRGASGPICGYLVLSGVVWG